MKLFYFGSNLYDECISEIESSDNSILVHEKNDYSSDQLSKIQRLYTSNKAYEIKGSSSKNNLKEIVNTGLLDRREKIIANVLNDYKIPLLQTRFKRLDLAGAYGSSFLLIELIEEAIEFYIMNRPSSMYCVYTPHTVSSWIFVRTLEESGVKVVRLVLTPLPWVFMPVIGLNNEKVNGLAPARMLPPSDNLSKYIKKLEGSYETAIPYYEKNIKKNFLKIFYLIEYVRYIERLIVRWEFKKVIQKPTCVVSYAVYFLHYQPEMNTLPEAGLYCDQYLAIRKLSDALPEGVELWVKEHPSTFSKRCDRRWRPRNFYRRLASLANVRICEEGINVFKLIDNSIFVSSIAGICLTEALARNKLVVCFYSPRFSYFTEDLVIDANIKSQAELGLIIKKIINGEIKFAGRGKLIDCIISTIEKSYDGSINDSGVPSSVQEQFEITKRINLIFIKDAIDDKF